MTETSYSGFGPQTLPFLKALGFHQNREWFEDNRDIYETELREPLAALMDDIAHSKLGDFSRTCARNIANRTYERRYVPWSGFGSYFLFKPVL